MAKKIPVTIQSTAFLANSAEKKREENEKGLGQHSFGSGNNWQGPSINYILHVSHTIVCLRRMNTDARRDIFCSMMSSDDYLEATERLLKLDLARVQHKHREIIFVVLACCLKEKAEFNPFYSQLTEKLCSVDRKYRMAAQYAVWDKAGFIFEHVSAFGHFRYHFTSSFRQNAKGLLTLWEGFLSF